MNISELELALGWAEPRVLEIQAKLHHGRRPIPAAGLTTCSISWPTPRSFWWRGFGCGL